jgi:hypothetical protein
MTEIVAGMTPTEFINAVNDNVLLLGTTVTNLQQGETLMNVLTSGFDAFKNLFPATQDKTVPKIGMRGSSFKTILNDNYNKIDDVIINSPSSIYDLVITNLPTFLAAPGVNVTYQYIVENIDSYKFVISLKVRPVANVVVEISTENGYVSFSSETITFTPDNYSVAQEITIQGKGTTAWRTVSGIFDENIILTFTSEDTHYNLITNTTVAKVMATEMNYQLADPFHHLNASSIYSSAVNVSDRYHFDSDSDLETLKTDIISKIWFGDGFPTKVIPDAIETRVAGDTYFNPVSTNLDSINKLTWMMGQGYGNYHYHCIPAVSNNKCVFFPFGHGNTWAVMSGTYGYDTLINQLIDAGYYVICSYEVGLGSNALIKKGPDNHTFADIEEAGVYNPLELFITDWICEMNYIKVNFSFSEISMMGHSGGGEITLFSSALLPDVKHSFCIAGALAPTFFQSVQQGHYEKGSATDIIDQFFYDHSSVDFIALAAQNRNHHQIVNYVEYGTTYKKYIGLWEDNIKSKLLTLTTPSVYTVDYYNYPAHYVNQDCVDIIMGYINH